MSSAGNPADNSTSEKEVFDPYRVWLSIPKAEQPPNHYRLLGISLFESDLQVIQEGADRQIGYLKTKQTGKHVALSQQLLQQVAAAAGCLLDPPGKAKYDDQLRAKLQAARQPIAKPLPQAAPLAPAPAPGYQQAQQPQYQQPQYQQPALYQNQHYQNPGYQQGPPPQPGYSQPGAYSQPHPQQLHPQQQPQYQQQPGYSHGYQQPQPMQQLAPQQMAPQPLRPVPVSAPVAPAEPTNPTPVLTGSSHSSGRGRAKERNVVVEMVKVVVGGAAGIGIALAGLAMIGRMDLIYGLIGQSPPVEVVQTTKVRPTTKVVKSTTNATDSGTSAVTSSTTSATTPAKITGTDTAGTETTPAAVDPSVPSTTAPATTDTITPSESTTAASATGAPLVATVQATASSPFVPPAPPLPDNTTKQVASAAMREGLGYAADIAQHLQKVMLRDVHRQQARDLEVALRQVRAGASPAGAIPSEDSQLAKFRREMLASQLEPIDRTYFAKGVHQTLSGKLLCSMGIPSRASIGPGGPELFVTTLNDYLETVCLLAAEMQDVPEAHDRLCYLAAVCRVLQFSYQRGNAEQLPACQLVEGLGLEVVRTFNRDDRKAQLVRAQDELFRSIGLHDSMRSNSFESDPRKLFRGNGGSFERQADGRWIETHPMRGTVAYTERRRTSTIVELMPVESGNLVRLALSWLQISIRNPANIADYQYAYHEGYWDVPKSARSLTPRLVVQFPSSPDVMASATDPMPTPSNPSTTPPGTGLTNPLVTTPTSNPPTATAPAGKRLWRHASGFFELSADGVWKELAPTGDYFTLTPLSQGGDIMEFERTTGGFRLRVHDNRVEYSQSPYVTYIEVAKGGWAKPIDEVELDTQQQFALKRNCDLYNDALTKARKTLIDRFESAMSSNRKRIGKAEERLAVVAVLEEENARFEKEGLVPWSLPMRPATADYLAAVNRARLQAEQSFDRAIDYYVNHEQQDTANSVLVLKQKTLVPLMIARLISRELPRPGFAGPMGPLPPNLPPDVVERIMRDRAAAAAENGVFRLWSNGQLNEVVGPSKWTTENNALLLNIVRPTSANRDRIVIAETGNEFAGQSSSGANYTGSFASVLEPHERRPEAKYNPKPKPESVKPAPAAAEAVPAEEASK
ncbi:hypothetical protein ETAA8_67020 [Anatilimnocola aggregata]|uniref:Uncharacterized protein n=1 Tax=Anatilimnocola aggregata TaxID=2528021 RepID=A0A517YMV3_9BACT|nr:hypothetical protein [Anatilimnocola aggregata]QDU31543.1 hypothetical protein ETAA8_67020 [Anatilimnocola aggregata]